MKNFEIDTIRDAASALRTKDPLLSFELFKIAFINRPTGPFIERSYFELKKELGIKSFVIIGNCQAGIIANLIRDKSEYFQVDEVITAHLYENHNDSIYRILDKADYIITQNISDKFEGINTTKILELYPEKTIRILNLHFEGFHPDWCYLPIVNKERCQSPVGDYHNKTIINSFIKGDTIENALLSYSDFNYNQGHYSNIAEKSLNELKAREMFTDINMTDVISKHFEEGNCYFHTFNHPTKELLNIQVNRILNFIGQENNFKIETDGECLNRTILRVNPIVDAKLNLGLIRLDVEVDLKSFIRACYAIYDSHPGHIEAYAKLLDLKNT